MIDVMPATGDFGAQCHVVALPQMCPVSGNPQPGSYIAVRYTPAQHHLEVYTLQRYLLNFVGGWLRDGVYVRDMEQTIAAIATDCARAVGVPVTVRARLVLDAGRMGLTARGEP